MMKRELNKLLDENEWLRTENQEQRLALARADEINELLHAEIQQLKQHLATQLVPVPNNPGMAFISYPN